MSTKATKTTKATKATKAAPVVAAPVAPVPVVETITVKETKEAKVRKPRKAKDPNAVEKPKALPVKFKTMMAAISWFLDTERVVEFYENTVPHDKMDDNELTSLLDALPLLRSFLPVLKSSEEQEKFFDFEVAPEFKARVSDQVREHKKELTKQRKAEENEAKKLARRLEREANPKPRKPRAPKVAPTTEAAPTVEAVDEVVAPNTEVEVDGETVLLDDNVSEISECEPIVEEVVEEVVEPVVVVEVPKAKAKATRGKKGVNYA